LRRERGNARSALPCNEEGLVEFVVDVDDEVVVGDAVDARAGKLPVDQDALQHEMQFCKIKCSAMKAEEQTEYSASQVQTW
jgi:hypothetical protein